MDNQKNILKTKYLKYKKKYLKYKKMFGGGKYKFEFYDNKKKLIPFTSLIFTKKQGIYIYEINLDVLTQTNTMTGKIRPLRRKKNIWEVNLRDDLGDNWQPLYHDLTTFDITLQKDGKQYTIDINKLTLIHLNMIHIYLQNKPVYFVLIYIAGLISNMKSVRIF